MTRHSIRKEDVKFVINEEKRTVICYIEGTKQLFVNFVRDNLPLDNTFEMNWDKIMLPNRFVGKAVCSENDEWDEQKGRLLAYDRMKNEINTSFRRAAQYFVTWYDKKLSESVDILNNYCNKLHANKIRRQSVIAEMFSDKE